MKLDNRNLTLVSSSGTFIYGGLWWRHGRIKKTQLKAIQHATKKVLLTLLVVWSVSLSR